jgi:hypothetical protein
MKHKAKPLRRVALAQPVAETPLAKRMLSEMGPADFSVVKTMQSLFGAKLVHYRDQRGEVGTDPRWPV